MVGTETLRLAPPSGCGCPRAHRIERRSRRADRSIRTRFSRCSRRGARTARSCRSGTSGWRADLMPPPVRAQLAEELLRRLAASLRSGQLYSKGHPIITRNLEGLSTVLQLLHGLEPTVVI